MVRNKDLYIKKLIREIDVLKEMVEDKSSENYELKRRLTMIAAKRRNK